MGMDLYRGNEYFRCNVLTWVALLETAINYGWEPRGTGPPRGCLKGDWRGNYHGNEGQLFYARDAKKLARALEIFLKTPGTPQLKRNKRQREVHSAGRVLARDVLRLMRLIGARTTPAIGAKSIKKKTPRRLNNDQRKYIEQFISFCRKGSFRIY